jgi:hypothetical protein
MLTLILAVSSGDHRRIEIVDPTAEAGDRAE